MKKKINHIYKAAIYVRLSKEDGDLSDAVKRESNSISNQRDLIKNFLNDKNDIEIVSERVDDGYSGVNFDRPAFQLMLEDIKAGKVDCVVVKDLSRFGRNYIDSGRYIEQIFPMLGVRFIAVNDNYDSIDQGSKSDAIIVPFKNLINDAYCRDISIKIRSHLEIKRKNGEFIAPFTVYGYKKDPVNHNRIIVDDYAAGVVRNIYRWKMEGMSQQGIADRLNEQGILSPAEYKRHCGIPFSNSFQRNRKAQWSPVAVGRILSNPCYLGHLIQGKTTTPNYKVKKIIERDESEWIKIEDAFEPIISEEKYQTVQLLMKSDTKVASDSGKVFLFAGLLRCGDCGRQMSRRVSTLASGEKIVRYMCSANKKEKICSSHRILESALQEVVLYCLNERIEKIRHLKMLIEDSDFENSKRIEVKRLDLRIIQLQEEAEKYKKMKISLYEDLKSDLLSKDEYAAIRKEFDARKVEAEEMQAKLEEEKNRIMKSDVVRSLWMDSFVQYQALTQLTRELLTTLIDHIDVYEGGKIEVFFRYEQEYQEIMSMVVEQEAV